MTVLKRRLVDILVEGKHITEKQLEKALQIQKQTGKEIRDILVKEKFITEHTLLSILSKELYIPYLDLARFKIDPRVLSLVPGKISLQYKMVPVSLIGTTLTMAMADPLNIFAIDDLQVFTGYKIEPVIASEQEIMNAILSLPKEVTSVKEIAEAGMSDVKEMETLSDDHQLLDIDDALKDSVKSPIVKIVDIMIVEALKRRASDIHIEPMETDLRIRYRVDGQLIDGFKLPKKNQNAILARLKIISGLDITESRLPQDGRFKVKLRDREIDFRVSALPITYGQKFVLRALDKARLSFGLDKLDMSPRPLALFKQAIAKPYGMILVTGPTGSGKSTTLYSVISQLNTADRHIVTIEDPVEYLIEGLTQIQVKPEIGLTFASGLRSTLRQSPDVILIGEIRDFETADIAVKASLTGQLEFSTLHTNDACGAITRLIDMGVEPFLVASSVVVTSAQRLCRRICPQCKQAQTIAKATLEKIGIYENLKKANHPTIFRGEGCKYCNNTGYFERIAIHEVLLIDDEIREFVIKKSSSDQIKEFAIREKEFKTLRDDALDKCFQGIITLEEVLRVTTEDVA